VSGPDSPPSDHVTKVGKRVSFFLTSRARDDGRAGSAFTASVFFHLTKQVRDSGLPADVLVDVLEKDIPFALGRGTIAQATTRALDAAQRAVEDELALNEGIAA
jgi:hypothetical protein